MYYLYVAPACRQCTRACQWMQENQIPYAPRNLFSNLLDSREILQLLKSCKDPEKILNVQPALKAQAKTLLEENAMEPLAGFIQKNPSVLRRPLLSDGSRLWVQDEIYALSPPD